MTDELEPLTRLLMVAESLTGETCSECGIGEDDAQVLRDVHALLVARVQLLTAALTDAAEGLDRILLPSALHTNWHELKSYSTRARAALAAGTTESEARDAK